MPRSVWYDLVFNFCQTDTFPELDDQVRAAHGVCSVAAIDWLLAKHADKPFVFSAMTVREKARQFDTTQANYALVYANAMSGMTLGNTTKIALSAGGGSAIATALGASPCVLIHLGPSLNRMVTGGAHVLAFCRRGGKYHMFDSNFGAYTCSYSKGVSTWFANNVSTVRPTRGRYTDWAEAAHVIPFT